MRYMADPCVLKCSSYMRVRSIAAMTLAATVLAGVSEANAATQAGTADDGTFYVVGDRGGNAIRLDPGPQPDTVVVTDPLAPLVAPSCEASGTHTAVCSYPAGAALAISG